MIGLTYIMFFFLLSLFSSILFVKYFDDIIKTIKRNIFEKEIYCSLIRKRIKPFDQDILGGITELYRPGFSKT